MKNYRALVFAFLLGAVVSALLMGAIPIGHAQDQRAVGPLSFFTYSSNMTGIFDAGSGAIYLYDADLDKCLSVRQITQLGEPMKKIRNQGR